MSVDYQGDISFTKTSNVLPDESQENQYDNVTSNGTDTVVVTPAANEVELVIQSANCESNSAELGDALTSTTKENKPIDKAEGTSDTFVPSTPLDGDIKSSPFSSNRHIHDVYYSSVSLNQDEEGLVSEEPEGKPANVSGVHWKIGGFSSDSAAVSSPPGRKSDDGFADGPDKSPPFATPANSFSSLAMEGSTSCDADLTTDDIRPIPSADAYHHVQPTPCVDTGLAEQQTVAGIAELPASTVRVGADHRRSSLILQHQLTEHLNEVLPSMASQMSQPAIGSPSADDHFPLTTTTTSPSVVTVTAVPECVTAISPSTAQQPDSPSASGYLNLASIAHMSLEPDMELETTAGQHLPMSSRAATTAATTGGGYGTDPLTHSLNYRSNKQAGIQENLNRFSPAQVVAATGGAPPAILHDLDIDIDCDFEAFRQPVVVGRTPTVNSSSLGAGPSTVWHRVERANLSGETNQPPVPVIDLELEVNAHLQPTSAKEVEGSLQAIFGNFMAERYRLEVTASARAVVSGSNAPVAAASANARLDVDLAGTSTSTASSSGTAATAEDLSPFASIPQSSPDSMEAMVARNLVQIGDEINRLYGSRLDRMIKLLPEDECPVQMFCNVARALFTRGPTNWGQVVTLFYFGYRLVVRRVRSGLVNAFNQVYLCLIDFCRSVNIFMWIAQQGGWLIVKYLHSRRATNDDEEKEPEGEENTTRSATGPSKVTSAPTGPRGVSPSVEAEPDSVGATAPPGVSFWGWSVDTSSLAVLVTGFTVCCAILLVRRVFSGGR